MTKMLKADLINENIRLRDHCDKIESQRDAALKLNQSYASEVANQADLILDLDNKIKYLRAELHSMQDTFLGTPQEVEASLAGTDQQPVKTFFKNGILFGKFHVKGKMYVQRPMQ